MGGEIVAADGSSSISRRVFIRRCLAVAFTPAVIVSFTLDELSIPAAAAPNQTKPNQTKPNQTKPNQPKPKLSNVFGTDPRA